MSIKSSFKAALVAVSVLGLSACGGNEPDIAAFDAEVQQLIESGDMYGRLYAALQDRRPELYADLRKVALQAYGAGHNARQSGILASRRMRTRFVDELLALSKSASDAHVREIIAIVMDTYTYLNEEDSMDCLRNIRGEPMETVKSVPGELQKREIELVVELLTAPQSANRRAASPNEVANWTRNVTTLEPSIQEAFLLMEEDRLGAKQAKIICDGHILLYKRLSYRKPETRGTLFRGMALMTLRERAQNRPSEEDDAKS